MHAAKPFPLNAWYAAAWSHEIRHELAARTICDKDVVLYRGSDGGVVALEDACWHRLLPLLPFYNLNIDAGALRARRMIDRLLVNEQGQGARPPGVAAE